MTNSSLAAKVQAYVSETDFLYPLVLALLFLTCYFFFSMVFFCILVTILLVLINTNALDSRFTENMLWLCLPVMTLTANQYSICLVYNATVFMLWTRAYANDGTIKPKYVLLYLLMIVSFLWKQDSALIVYTGGIMHGIAGPLNIFLYSRKNKFINKLCFLIPLWMLYHNTVSGYYFVAYWDVEIISYYFFWFLGYNKQTVVKRIFTLSLFIIVWAHTFYDVCLYTEHTFK